MHNVSHINSNFKINTPDEDYVPDKIGDIDLGKLKKTGQTYGCNALYRDFTPDYLFSVDAMVSREISKSKIWQKGCVCMAYKPTPTCCGNRLGPTE